MPVPSLDTVTLTSSEWCLRSSFHDTGPMQVPSLNTVTLMKFLKIFTVLRIWKLWEKEKNEEKLKLKIHRIDKMNSNKISQYFPPKSLRFRPRSSRQISFFSNFFDFFRNSHFFLLFIWLEARKSEI